MELKIGDEVVMKKTDRKYRVVGIREDGAPLFRFLRPDLDDVGQLHGPTMTLNAKRYTKL